MFVESRRNQILSLLRSAESDVLSIADLSKLLNVSEMTVRRDLDSLEEKSLIKRVPGGAFARRFATVENSLEERAGQHHLQKAAIGRLAVRFIQPGDSILLDAGTTTQQIATLLAEMPGGMDAKGVTVITNNLTVALTLSDVPNIKTHLLGGQLKPRERCTVGMNTRQMLANFRVDKCFLSTAGFSLRSGITDIDLAEVEIKQGMIEAAREVTLVADSSKYNVVGLIKVASLSAAARLICDDGLDADAINEMEAEGIEVITPARIPSDQINS
jgi:DeoR family transcriptional regulator, fructose operon transcriptional repressor